jgi:hypothetical protein
VDTKVSEEYAALIFRIENHGTPGICHSALNFGRIENQF